LKSPALLPLGERAVVDDVVNIADLGSFQVVFLVLWSIKYVLPFPSLPFSQPAGSGPKSFILFWLLFKLLYGFG
jgi:hypothetical protein